MPARVELADQRGALGLIQLEDGEQLDASALAVQCSSDAAGHEARALSPQRPLHESRSGAVGVKDSSVDRSEICSLWEHELTGVPDRRRLFRVVDA